MNDVPGQEKTRTKRVSPKIYGIILVAWEATAQTVRCYNPLRQCEAVFVHPKVRYSWKVTPEWMDWSIWTLLAQGNKQHEQGIKGFHENKIKGFGRRFAAGNEVLLFSDAITGIMKKTIKGDFHGFALWFIFCFDCTLSCTQYVLGTSSPILQCILCEKVHFQIIQLAQGLKRQSQNVSLPFHGMKHRAQDGSRLREIFRYSYCVRQITK